MKSSETPSKESLLTLKEVSELLNCHPNTLREWDKSGYLKAIRLGKRGDRRYHKEEVLKLINKKDR